MIRLEDFPRPKDDNGRGIHWSASPYHLSGHELDPWLNELLAMKIKWVKVLDDGGGSSLDLCRRLVEIGIMPVVRLYIGNPGHVGPRNLQAIERLIHAGAFYFETNNEPDLAIEWPDGVVPRNWLEIVVDNFIIDATEVIKLGGFPAFPAMGVGTIVNPFELVVQRGRQELFDQGAWLAIHNYVLNHPLDYPLDEVNQTGKPLTPEEYQQTRWGWDNDQIETINRLRREGATPGETLQQDATCWLAYKLWDDQINQAFGHSVPIMSTEGGVVVGDRQDGRYPRNDARRHEEVTLWIQDFLAREAPPWYFTVFHWLIANNAMGQNRPGWETQAWYGNWWDKEFGLNGRLPSVDALKRTAAPPRGDVTSDAMVQGRLFEVDGRAAAERRVTAVTGGRAARITDSDANGAFRLWGLMPGTYDLQIHGILGFPVRDLALTAHGSVNREVRLPSEDSGVGGRMIDSDGKPRSMQTVMLYQSGRLVASVVTEQEGYYGFVPLAAGSYELKATGAGSQLVQLDGETPATVDITVRSEQSFEYLIVMRRLLTRGENQGRHAFFGTVLDEAGNPVNGVRLQMAWKDAEPGTVFPIAVSGADPGKPRGYFEFIHTGGEFTLRVLDQPWRAQAAEDLRTVGLPGQIQTETVSYEIVFQLVPLNQMPSEGGVSGLILGSSEGVGIALHGEGRLYAGRVGADGSFRFAHLPVGTYTLDLECIGVLLENIAIDGSSAIALEPIDIRSTRKSVIQGAVFDARDATLPGVSVLLSRDSIELARTVTDASGTFRFDSLAAGTYVVQSINPSSSPAEISADGTRMYLVDLHVSVGSADKHIRHYLLFGPAATPGSRTNFRLARKYVLSAGASAGFSPTEAALAERVTLIGDERVIGRDVEEMLRKSGCQVGRIAGDSYAVADGLARLMGER